METTDTISGMPLTTTTDMEIGMSITNLRPALQWVANRLPPEELKKFIHLATQPHPITGKTRQDALRITGVGVEALRAQVKAHSGHVFKRRMLLSHQWHEFRLGEDTMKLGSGAFNTKAKDWYNDSRDFMDIIKDVTWAKTDRKVHIHPKGYLWITQR